MKHDLKLLAGTSHPQLAEEIRDYLDIPVAPVAISKFANDNIFVKIQERIRGDDIFVLQTSCPPVNDGLMELLIILHALKNASPERITSVVPYYPYVRSDKKDQPRISITAALVADLLQAAGAHRVLTMNLHSAQIMGFFRIPIDQLLAGPLLCRELAKEDLHNSVLVAPDAGSAKFVESYARILDLPIAILDKRRYDNDDRAEILHIVGEVRNKHAIICDDEISTGGSLLETVDALKGNGAISVRATAVHGVLCGDAPDRIEHSELQQVIVTNTVPVPPEKQGSKIKVISVAKILGEAIRRIHEGRSVSRLFNIKDRGDLFGLPE